MAQQQSGAFVVCVEGEIGAGKSKLCAQLVERLPEIVGPEWTAVFIPEPVDTWIESGLLKLQYEDTAKYGLPFEVMVYTTRVQALQRHAHEFTKPRNIVVIERSPFTDKEIFLRHRFVTGAFDELQYKQLRVLNETAAYVTPARAVPDLFLYLNVPVSECQNRVRARSRNGESSVDGVFQQSIKLRHYDLFHLDADSDDGWVQLHDPHRPSNCNEPGQRRVPVKSVDNPRNGSICLSDSLPSGDTVDSICQVIMQQIQMSL